MSQDSPYRYFDELFNRPQSPVLSLDIETTSLYPGKGKGGIWSMGIASDSMKMETFYDPLRRMLDPQGNDHKARTNDLIRYIQESGSFNKKQLESGAMKDLISASEKGELKYPLNLLNTLGEEIKPSSVVLIQNADFENRWIKSLVDNAVRTSTPFVRPPMMRPLSAKDSNSYFLTAPEVKEGRSISRSILKELFSSSDPQRQKELLQRYVESTRGVMSAYQRIHASLGQSAMTIDLMDMIRALYAEAAGKGHLDPRYMTTGTRVNFLSQLLLGEKESHTALSDGDQQLRIAKKIAPMTQRIVDDALTDEDRLFLEKVRKFQPIERESQAIASVFNRLEEFRAGEPVTMPSGVWKVSMTKGSDEARGKVPYYTAHSVSVKSEPQLLYLTAEMMKDRGEGDTPAYRFVESLFLKRGATSDSEAFESLEKMRERLGSIDYMADSDEQIAQKMIQESEIPTRPAPPPPPINEAKTESKVFGPGATSAYDFVSKHKGKLAFAGGLAVLMNMNFTSSDQISKNRREKKAVKQDQQTIERAINLYDTSYHGDGFVAWNNRKKHHEM